MKKRILICLIIFPIALFMYFCLVYITFSLCGELFEDEPFYDPYDWCGTTRPQFFFRVIGRGSIYWAIVVIIMVIIIFKGDKSKKIKPKINAELNIGREVYSGVNTNHRFPPFSTHCRLLYQDRSPPELEPAWVASAVHAGQHVRDSGPTQPTHNVVKTSSRRHLTSLRRYVLAG